MEFILYKKGYKYQLHESYSVNIPVIPVENINSDYIALTVEGSLTIEKGYAWDGPSGPTIDTLNFMRGSLVHDVLYQLMREGKLDKDKNRKLADRLLQQMCKQDGMSSLRAWWVYTGLRFGGGSAADSANKKTIVVAPKHKK